MKGENPMKIKTRTNKLVSTLLAMAVMFGLFAAIPLTVNADTAAELKGIINSFNPGPGSTGKFEAVTIAGRPIIIVTGTVTGATNTLELDINSGLTVQWAADFSGNTSANGMIALFGGGTFEVATAGSVKNNGSSYGIYAVNSITINIRGGTVSAASAIAIHANGNPNIVNVSAGTVSSGGNVAISAAATNDAVNVSGGFVFSQAAEITGSLYGPASPTIRMAAGKNPAISGNAVVCAWNKPSSPNPTYTDGTATDLITNSGATVKWGKSSGQSGIGYANGTNIGFFLIGGITINPPPVYAVKVVGGMGGGNYEAGMTVNIKANSIAGKVFDKWTADGVTLSDSGNSNTYFIMPANAVTVTANFKSAPATTYSVTFKYNNGEPDWVQTVSAGDKADYGMDPIKAGFNFAGWCSDAACNTIYDFNTPVTANITLYAKWTAISTTTYKVTVNNGTGGGSYAAGTKINITANAAPSGKVFDKWATSDGVSLASAASASTSFTMPSKAVTVTANYKDLPAGTYAVNVITDGGGTVNANVTYAKEGDIVKLTVIEGEGYMFKKWDVIDGPVAIMGDEFTMPGKSVTLKALFEPIPGANIPGVTEPAETSEPANPDDTSIPGNGSETTPGNNGGGNGNNMTWLWILLGVLAVVAIGSGIVFIIIRKKGETQAE